MTIRELQKICYQDATKKGWNDRPVEVPEQVALICSEACEALECYRKDEPLAWLDENGKPQGIAFEYADIVIRVMHYAALLEIDLEEAIEKKLAFNRGRQYRHGGKRA
jgi:NTP pyrophosphatase (non-canonical NTP hydrolase)